MSHSLLERGGEFQEVGGRDACTEWVFDEMWCASMQDAFLQMESARVVELTTKLANAEVRITLG